MDASLDVYTLEAVEDIVRGLKSKYGDAAVTAQEFRRDVKVTIREPKRTWMMVLPKATNATTRQTL